MSEPEKPKAEGRPESPTTARELDFDDDEPASHPQTPAKTEHGSNLPPAQIGTPTPAATTQAPPQQPQPNKQLGAREQGELTLREAFPGIEPSVVKAVLVASGGQVEPAFHALLSMSDPDAQAEAPAVAAPPPQPPRQAAPTANPQARSQLEADELYARQLAEHYQRQDMRAARAGGDYIQQHERGGRPPRGVQPPEERERNFIDDDLPELGENIKKGFFETQQKLNGWFNNLKKRMDGEEEDGPSLPPRRGTGFPSEARRSADYDRYDADPEEFDNDFTKLQLRDTEAPPKQPPRPGANPDLFKPTPPTPSQGRRVSFQDGPPEEITDAPGRNKSPGGNKSKWQPLAAVDPSPVADHDPFSLGDSDEEDTKKKDGDTGDSERLKKAMAEAAEDDIGNSSDKKSESAASGAKDKEEGKVADKS